MGCITLWEINQFSKKIFTSLWTMVMDAVIFFAFKLTYSRITAKLERRYTFILWWGDRDSGRSKKSEGGGGNRLSNSISAFVFFSICAKSEGSPPCPSTSGVPGRAQSKVATRWIKKNTLKQKQFYHETHKNSNLICFCKPYQLFTMFLIWKFIQLGSG